MENPIKMADLGGTTIFGNIHIACGNLFHDLSRRGHLLNGAVQREYPTQNMALNSGSGFIINCPDVLYLI